MDRHTHMPTSDGLTGALVSLGFSTYEARTYVGLLKNYGQTAYALSKETGVPQPKIYEAVRKLVDKRAAVQLSDAPQRFAATPVDQLLRRLRSDFDGRLDDAERTAAEVLSESDRRVSVEALKSLQGKESALELAVEKISSAGEKIYVTGWGEDFPRLARALHEAEERGVEVVAMVFGRGRFSLKQGSLYRHTSTSKVLYRSHQNRHLAVIADGETAMWAVAFQGGDWSTLEFDDRRLIGLLRQFVRHDIYVQKIYAALGGEMESAFGPGLELLVDLTQDSVAAQSADGAAPRTRRRPSA